MRRRKQTIATLLYGFPLDMDAVYHHVEIWSDIVCSSGVPTYDAGARMPKLTYFDTGRDPVQEQPVQGQTGSIDRWLLWGELAGFFDHQGLHVVGGSMYRTVVGMAPNWIISDPHIVRDAIELNPENTLMAKRYFMWTDTHYRKDGIYIPISLPIAYPFQRSVVFTSPVDIAPSYTWHSGFHADAPFSILDYTYHGSDTVGATLREFEGMIPV